MPRFRPLCRLATLSLALAVAWSPAARPAGLDPASFMDAEFHASGALGWIGAQHAYALGYTGRGVLLAVIDSGLHRAHPEFAGRISPASRNMTPLPGQSWADISDLDEEGKRDGHGTHVAGLALAARDGRGMQGVAYEAGLLVLRSESSHDDLADLKAIDYAVSAGARVLNGSYGPDAQPQPDSPYYPAYSNYPHQLLFLDQIQAQAATLRKAAAADLLMVFAAGNDFENQPVQAAHVSGYGMYHLISPGFMADDPAGRFFRFADTTDLEDDPATWAAHLLDPSDPRIAWQDYSDLGGAILSVAALGPDGLIARYSNRCGAAAAYCLAAPGGDVHAPGYPGRSGGLWSAYPDDGQGTYYHESGTSMAAPVASGAAAVLRQAYPFLTARQVIEIMLTTANRQGAYADRGVYGWGLLDLGRAALGPAEFGAEGFPALFQADTAGYDARWRGDIAGRGGLVKSGPGTLTLSGRNTYQGPTQVLGGRLVVDGWQAASPVYVGPQGRLGGRGTVGPAMVAGVVAPGNSIGTLTVAGDYVQLTGSVLEMEFDGEGRHDSLVVEGHAHIQGGELRLLGLRPEFLGRDFALLSAAGGASGRFDQVPQDYPFLSASPVFSGAGLSLSVRRSALPFAAFAASGNQRAVADAIERQGAGDWPYRRLIGLRDTAPVAGLLRGMSGELHASAQSVLLDAGESWRQIALARLRGAQGDALGAARPDGWQAWGQGFGQWGRLDGSAAAAGVDRRASGLALGVERRLGTRGYAGLGAGVSHVEARGADLGRARAEGYQWLAYGGWESGAWRWRLGAAHGWHHVRSSRQVEALGGGVLQARYRLRATQLFAEVGYSLPVGEVRLEPYAGLAQVWQRSGAFQESGGPAALSAEAARLRATVATLGLRAQWQLAAGGMSPRCAFGLLPPGGQPPPRGCPASVGRHQYTVTAGLGWRRMLNGAEPARALRLASGHGFEVAGAPLARDALALELDLSWRRPRTDGGGWRVELGYRGQLARQARDHGAQLRLAWAF